MSEGGQKMREDAARIRFEPENRGCRHLPSVSIRNNLRGGYCHVSTKARSFLFFSSR